MARHDITDSHEAELHTAFDITLILKAIHATLEIVGGIFLYGISSKSILDVTQYFVRDEIAEDPHDVIATYLLHAAQSFGGSTQAFTALYLLSHGIINGLVVLGLWRKKVWAYPISIVVLAGFIAYQLYLLALGFSWWLIFLTVLDLIVIMLVWHEYGVLKRRR